MIKRLRELNEALPEILFIDFLYLILGELIIVLLIPDCRIYAVGFLFGVIYAVFSIFHMSLKIRKVVYGRASTRKTLILGYLVRLLVMVALFAVLYYFNIGDLLTALIGMFAMKVSAYLQPVVSGITSKILKKRRVKRW